MRDKYKECIARHNLYSILREIHEGKKRNVYCAAGFKAISIDIDGYIYPCHRFVGDKEFCMGDVSTNVFEHDVIYNQLYKIPEKCKYCICQSICSGGCMHDNLLLMKNINIPAECNCKLQKVFVWGGKLLWRIIIFWKWRMSIKYMVRGIVR